MSAGSKVVQHRRWPHGVSSVPGPKPIVVEVPAAAAAAIPEPLDGTDELPQ